MLDSPPLEAALCQTVTVCMHILNVHESYQLLIQIRSFSQSELNSIIF